MLGVLSARSTRRSTDSRPSAAHGPVAILLSLAAVAISRLGARLLCLRQGPVQVGKASCVIAPGTAANIAGITSGLIVFANPMPGSVSSGALQALAFLFQCSPQRRGSSARGVRLAAAGALI